MNPQDNQQPADGAAPQQPQPVQPFRPLGGDDSDNQPQLVYMSRPHEPVKQEMSPEVKRRHEESKARHPHLNLSEGEFIISEVRRHPIGLLQIWAIVGTLIALLMGILLVMTSASLVASLGLGAVPLAVVAIPVLLLTTLALIFGFIETSVYNANTFYLTNESVIQHIQTSLFSKREQTVSLSNIEDASYQQHGIIQSLFNYGMIRLSTEGDETTYRFAYATNPKQQVAVLNNAVEAFKNGRPVTG